MTLEKSFRALVSPAYEPIDPVATTDEEALDLAQLNTDSRQGLENFSVLGIDTWPNSLTLRVRLLPVPFSQKMRQIMAQFVSNEKTFTPTLFYDGSHQEGNLLNNCYTGIDLIYEGTGSLEHENTSQFFSGWGVGEYRLNTAELIYHKPFPTQLAAPLLFNQQHLGAGKWSMTTHHQNQPKVNEIAIFSYGGVYQPHLTFDLVMPIYATLAGTNDLQTRVTLRSQKFWHDKGILETQSVKVEDTTYAFHDPIAEEARMNLGAVLAGGRVKVCLEREGEQKEYQSRRYQNIPGHQGIVDITFVTTE
jgi:hypothetical protein